MIKYHTKTIKIKRNKITFLHIMKAHKKETTTKQMETITYYFIQNKSINNESESISCSVVSDSLQPFNCSPPGSSVNGISQARILELSCHPLLQGTFPTQGSNPGLLHCKQILYQLSCLGNPCIIWIF